MINTAGVIKEATMLQYLSKDIHTNGGKREAGRWLVEKMTQKSAF